jgi:serine/threonine protein kinase
MIGQLLNQRYNILSLLGEGGMGEVYLAIDQKTGEQVAVKILARSLSANPDSLERFRREAEALRQLDHPNIVKFVDAFEYEGQYVIVMEQMPGGSLHERIGKGPLPVEEARQIALDLCDALIRAHRLRIIHRDIKPDNVLIAEDGTPKLADFGVARLSEGTRMTRSGTQVGTPYYMSPEAWEGKTLDAQADIWSLGVILFEMLSGQVPFGGDTGAAVMNKVLTIAPPDLRKLRADVPTGLVRIVSLMLTRDKQRRYQTMRQVAADLESSQLAALTVSKPRPTTAGLAKKAGGASLIGLAFILIISAVWWTNQSRRAQSGRLPPIQVTDSTNTPRPSPTISPTSEPTGTPNPLEASERLDVCGSDLCFYDFLNRATPIGLAKDFVLVSAAGPQFSLSPDGARIVFSGCSLTDLAASGDCRGDIYIANRDGDNVVRLQGDPAAYELRPSWSPDGKFIVFNEGWTVWRIDPDGSELKQIAFGELIAESYMYVWSPDSQRIAWASGRHKESGEPDWDRLYVINRDGSGLRSLLYSPDPLLTGQLAWSPDGQSLAVGFRDGRTYLFDANCGSASTGCEFASAIAIEAIPQDWLPNVYPQWGKVYLTQLEPKRAEVGYATLGVGVWTYTEGDVLNGAVIKSGGIEYPNGLFAHAPSTIIYDLSGQFSLFHTSYFVHGYEPECNYDANQWNGVIFQIHIDGKKAFESDLMDSRPPTEPQSTTIDVEGINTLTLTIDPVNAENFCDITVWGDPYLLR